MVDIKDEGSHAVCERCRKRVEPGQPGVIEAAQLIRADTFAGSEQVEGQHVFFHQACYRVGSSYRRIV
jgi:hypothetical protein